MTLVDAPATHDLDAALVAHAHRDLARLRDLAPADPRAASLAACADAMGPEAFRRLPACGGTHLLGTAAAPADRDLALVLAEAAALAGAPFAATVATTRRTVLGAHRAVVTYTGSAAEASVESDGGTVRLRWPDAEATVGAAGTSATGAATVGAAGAVPALSSAGPAAPLLPGEVRVDPIEDDDAARGYDRARTLLRIVWPELSAAVEAAGTHMVPIAPAAPGAGIASFSERRLPFLVFLNLARGNPIDICDQLVHEFHHSALFLVEEQGRLLGEPGAVSVSPWRAELRNAEGLVHGVYVFSHVAGLYERVWQRWRPTRSAVFRTYALRASVAAGVELLHSAGSRPTEAGRALLAAVAAENDAAIASARDADPALWADAEDAVASHLRQAGTPSATTPTYLAFL